MNKTKTFILFILFLLFAPSFVRAEIFPSFPMSFYGNATLNNSALPIGSKIQAYEGDILKGEVIIGEAGVYGYNDPTKSQLVVSDFSKKIIFKYVLSGSVALVGCNDQNYSGKFSSGTIIEKNLVFTSCSQNSSSNSGGGGGGGGGSVSPVVVKKEETIVATTTVAQIATATINKDEATPTSDVVKNSNISNSNTAQLKNTTNSDANISKKVVAEEKIQAKKDYTLTSKLKGKILLQVENNGQAWYVNPRDEKKYYLGRPADCFSVMRKLGLGIKHDVLTNKKTLTKLAGKILLDVEDSGKSYYINPSDNKAYYLGKPEDAFNIMKKLGLGISNTNIRKILVGEVSSI